MNSTDGRVAELLDIFATPDASAAHLLCDRHPSDQVAFTVIATELNHVDLTYGELHEQSVRFAAALSSLGVRPGDHVATLMGKSAELVVALLGIWRLGAVNVPLFTAFAHDAIDFRLRASGTRLVVCDADQRHKLAPPGEVPTDASPLAIVARGEAFGYDLSFAEMVAGRGAFAELAEPPAAVQGGDGVLIQLFTSGTTGAPKGVPVPLRAVASFVGYQEFGLDVGPGDVFWNVADPGWAYGLYFGVLAPLASGTRSLLLAAGFSPERTWQVLDAYGVTNLAGAPTVYRALRAGTPADTRHPLRRASSAGEPLTPDVLDWSREVFAAEVHDHYGQTEHGMVAGNAWADGLAAPVQPGAMGRSLPGWRLDVLTQDADTLAADGETGRLALHVPSSPFFWFPGYVDAPAKTAERYSVDGQWYITGDAGRRAPDGTLFFSSRDDDVIIMAGYRIGPFDVESVLAQHDAVMETAVIGAPDQVRGEVLEAFVVLVEGREGSEELVRELQQWVKSRFAAHAYPRRVHFVPELPKTPSGKVQRYLLRQQRASVGAE